MLRLADGPFSATAKAQGYSKTLSAVNPCDALRLVESLRWS